MDYIWYPVYREAILETDQPKMRARLFLAEKKIVDRLRILAQDHGGTDEERQAIAHALTGIKNLRTETSGWSRGPAADVAQQRDLTKWPGDAA